jgi:ubiquinone/menaquinone biosynthesis C-methylase UbiE
MTAVRHPIFARMYRRFAVTAEAKGGSAHRDELLAGVSGRVIEVGAGHGLNFSHYPSNVGEVTAVEPEAYLREGAIEAAARAPVSIKVVDGVADALPFEDGSFDVGVASLVLCSVADQPAALAELHRVLRPGGELRFYEHVRAEEPRLARLQDRADRVWPILGGGCHCNRDTLSAIGRAGFVVEEVRSFRFRPCLVAAPVVPHIIGRARRP